MGKTWWCQCCNNHRSGYLRQCSCCERWIAPGCSPEKCLMLDKQHGAPYNLCKKCVTLAIYIILFLLPPQAENHNYNHRKKRRLNEIEWSLSMYVCGSLAAARKSPQATVKMMQLMFRCGHDFLNKIRKSTFLEDHKTGTEAVGTCGNSQRWKSLHGGVSHIELLQ